ncbi:glycosyltransferase family 2 protein [Rufibacter sp. DG15C]|uniref:glycosyltransferase family 2 protein n=1 Tax=Rufibacter sp. DG15C TaxID=1379909 RepID=UPI001E472219|nr:glycosyltransferase family 2 protein [Rufibacter sp. DG15C]
MSTRKRKTPLDNLTSSSDMTTSLIITTYNWKEALEVVLKSVLTQTEMPEEVIIADDGSREDTTEVIKQYQATFPVPLKHSWQEDLGFRAAESRNRAMAMATGDYLIIIDGDMVLHPDFVKDHKRAAEPDTFMHGKRVLLQPVLTQQILQTRQYHVTPFSSGIINRLNTLSIPVLSNLLSKKQPDIRSIRSCNMAFWRKDVLRINGFNNDFVGWGREDSEFAERLLNAGVIRKNLVLGGVGYHLYHEEKPRTSLPANDKILADAIAQKATWCQNGIDKFLR